MHTLFDGNKYPISTSKYWDPTSLFLILAEAAVRNLFVASYDLIHFQEAIRVERKEMSASLFGDQISRPQKNIHHAFSI